MKDFSRVGKSEKSQRNISLNSPKEAAAQVSADKYAGGGMLEPRDMGQPGQGWD
jgi:hypothetical protein